MNRERLAFLTAGAVLGVLFVAGLLGITLDAHHQRPALCTSPALTVAAAVTR